MHVTACVVVTMHALWRQPLVRHYKPNTEGGREGGRRRFAVRPQQEMLEFMAGGVSQAELISESRPPGFILQDEVLAIVC